MAVRVNICPKCSFWLRIGISEYTHLSGHLVLRVRQVSLNMWGVTKFCFLPTIKIWYAIVFVILTIRNTDKWSQKKYILRCNWIICLNRSIVSAQSVGSAESVGSGDLIVQQICSLSKICGLAESVVVADLLAQLICWLSTICWLSRSVDPLDYLVEQFCWRTDPLALQIVLIEHICWFKRSFGLGNWHFLWSFTYKYVLLWIKHFKQKFRRVFVKSTKHRLVIELKSWFPSIFHKK